MECSNKFLKILIQHLKTIIDNLENGNSNLSQEELEEVIKMASNFSNRELRMSREQAARYLNMNIKTFDNHVKQGKLPKGTKELGLKEKTWVKKDLDDCIKNSQQRLNN